MTFRLTQADILIVRLQPYLCTFATTCLSYDDYCPIFFAQIENVISVLK